MRHLHQLDSAETEAALRNINIPPRPKVLDDIDRELRRENASLDQVGELVGRDVALSAAVLKTVNSPFFGLSRNISTARIAVQFLGANNLRSLVSGLLLRQSVGQGLSLERFWDSAERIARISARVAALVPRVSRDAAYTFGLFRDVGIPLMMQRFPNYKDTLAHAANVDVPLVAVEDAAHSTNHAVIGFMVARSWGLPDVLREAILAHHNHAFLAEDAGLSPPACTLVAINFLADYLNDELSHGGTHAQWQQVGDPVLDYLGLNGGHLDELKAEGPAL